MGTRDDHVQRRKDSKYLNITCWNICSILHQRGDFYFVFNFNVFNCIGWRPRGAQTLINGCWAPVLRSANIPVSLFSGCLFWMIYWIDINLFPITALPKLEYGDELMFSSSCQIHALLLFYVILIYFVHFTLKYSLWVVFSPHTRALQDEP